GGVLFIVFLLARWRPVLGQATSLAAAMCFLVLFVGPGVWALSPVFGVGGMLPSASPETFARLIREREQRAQEAARAATLASLASNATVSPDLLVAAAFASSDFALLLRSPRNGPPAFAAGMRGMGPGMQPREDERSRQDREKMAAFLKANHNGERWLRAVPS